MREIGESPVAREVLSLAVDDFTGVWEVAAIVASLDPALDDEAVRETARKETVGLVTAGLLDVFVGPWVGTAPKALTGNEAAAAVSDPVAYARPPTAPILAYVMATSRGEAAYFGESDDTSE
jgi:hypothetical protein